MSMISAMLSYLWLVHQYLHTPTEQALWSNPAGLEQSCIYTIDGNFISEELQLLYYRNRYMYMRFQSYPATDHEMLLERNGVEHKIEME